MGAEAEAEAEVEAEVEVEVEVVEGEQESGVTAQLERLAAKAHKRGRKYQSTTRAELKLGLRRGLEARPRCRTSTRRWKRHDNHQL